MDEQDRVKQKPTVVDPPQAPVVSLVTLDDSTLATIITTRHPENTKREIAVTWVRGSMIAIVVQLSVVMLNTARADNLAEVSAFLNAIYPLMLKFNLTVICPPVVYMVASYFAEKRERPET
jgi:hypothetical protein